MPNFASNIIQDADEQTFSYSFAFSVLFELTSVVVAILSEVEAINNRLAAKLLFKFAALFFFAVGIISKGWDIKGNFGHLHVTKVKLEELNHLAVSKNLGASSFISADNKSTIASLTSANNGIASMRTHGKVVGYGIIGSILLLVSTLAELVGLFYFTLPIYLIVGLTSAAPLLASLTLETYENFIKNIIKYGFAQGLVVQEIMYADIIGSMAVAPPATTPSFPFSGSDLPDLVETAAVGPERRDEREEDYSDDDLPESGGSSRTRSRSPRLTS